MAAPTYSKLPTDWVNVWNEKRLWSSAACGTWKLVEYIRRKGIRTEAGSWYCDWKLVSEEWSVAKRRIDELKRECCRWGLMKKGRASTVWLHPDLVAQKTEEAK